MRIAIAGSSGRMGRTLIECVLKDTELKLTGALEQPGHALLGKDPGEFAAVRTGIAVGADIEAALSQSDLLIDFTRPQGTLAHMEACVKLGRKMVIGTTGFSEAEKASMTAA